MLEIISQIYKKIGIPIHTVTELTKIVENNQKVWDIYKNGYTICINQCEKLPTTQKVMKYQPKNIGELTSFIASIRPSFKSMYSTFESRKPFSYGIKAFDELIQTEQMPNSFILFQEQLMQTFNFAGFPITECYSIIKAVAKKKPEKLKVLKEEFNIGFAKKLKEVQPELTEKQLESYCNKVWQIAEDSANYSFNSSHALAYAYDSLYGAYLKSHYPLEFYSTILEIYSTEKVEKDRIKEIIKEMKKAFGIELNEIKFGYDNRSYSIDRENNRINASLRGIKSIGKNTPQELYDIPKDINNFVDLLVYIKENAKIKKNEINILISIGYFQDFGGIKKLLKIYEEFVSKYSKTNSEKTKNKKIEDLKDLFRTTPDKDLSEIEKIVNDLQYIDDTHRKIEDSDLYIVTKMELKFGKYTIELFEVKTGDRILCSIDEKVFINNKFILFTKLVDIEFYTTRYGNKRLDNYKVIIK